MSNFSIYEYYHLDSIENKLLRSDIAFERKVRRWFAKEYNQLVKNTYKLPWTEIVAEYYDSQIEQSEYNTIYEIAENQYLPEVAEAREESDQAYADSLIEEQKRSMKKTEKIEKKEEVNLTFNMDDPDKDLK